MSAALDPSKGRENSFGCAPGRASVDAPDDDGCDPIGSALRVGSRTAAALMAGGLVILPLVVIAGRRVRQLPIIAIAIVGGAAGLVALRWPLVGLMAFAVLIPVEEVTLVGGTATLSQLAGLAFPCQDGGWTIKRPTAPVERRRPLVRERETELAVHEAVTANSCW